MTEPSVLCIQPAYLDGFRCDLSDCPLGRIRPEERCPALRDLRIHDVYERSLLLSCPHAASAILPRMTSFRFATRRLPAEALSPANKTPPSLREPRPEHSYLLDLQRASLHILSMHRYPMNARLVLLGIFLEDALEAIEGGHGYHLGKIMKSYASPFFEARFHEALKNIEFEPLAHLDFLVGLLQTLAAEEGGPLTSEDLLRTRHAYHLDEAPDLARLRRTYLVNRRESGRLTLLLPSVPERLLLHQFYTELYPCACPGGIIHNYWLFVLTWKISELLLTALAAIERDSLSLSAICTLLARTSHLPQNPLSRGHLERALDGKEDDSVRLFRILFDISG